MPLEKTLVPNEDDTIFKQKPRETRLKTIPGEKFFRILDHINDGRIVVDARFLPSLRVSVPGQGDKFS